MLIPSPHLLSTVWGAGIDPLDSNGYAQAVTDSLSVLGGKMEVINNKGEKERDRLLVYTEQVFSEKDIWLVPEVLDHYASLCRFNWLEVEWCFDTDCRLRNWRRQEGWLPLDPLLMTAVLMGYEKCLSAIVARFSLPNFTMSIPGALGYKSVNDNVCLRGFNCEVARRAGESLIKASFHHHLVCDPSFSPLYQPWKVLPMIRLLSGQ
jgi:hypothetical protein